jgi:hypothetical protein
MERARFQNAQQTMLSHPFGFGVGGSQVASPPDPGGLHVDANSQLYTNGQPVSGSGVVMANPSPTRQPSPGPLPSPSPTLLGMTPPLHPNSLGNLAGSQGSSGLSGSFYERQQATAAAAAAVANGNADRTDSTGVGAGSGTAPVQMPPPVHSTQHAPYPSSGGGGCSAGHGSSVGSGGNGSSLERSPLFMGGMGMAGTPPFQSGSRGSNGTPLLNGSPGMLGAAAAGGGAGAAGAVGMRVMSMSPFALGGIAGLSNSPPFPVNSALLGRSPQATLPAFRPGSQGSPGAAGGGLSAEEGGCFGFGVPGCGASGVGGVPGGVPGGCGSATASSHSSSAVTAPVPGRSPPAFGSASGWGVAMSPPPDGAYVGASARAHSRQRSGSGEHKGPGRGCSPADALGGSGGGGGGGSGGGGAGGGGSGFGGRAGSHSAGSGGSGSGSGEVPGQGDNLDDEVYWLASQWQFVCLLDHTTTLEHAPST